ncbi:MAG: hypothetical protein JRH20_07835 [Deltaproteobacteria bacterium]|nr:hypothetical protein [Deltaproteobacteria bacterium]
MLSLALVGLLASVSACKNTLTSETPSDASAEDDTLIARDGALPSDGDVIPKSDALDPGEHVTFDPTFTTVTITVSEPVGATREVAPVSGGVPFGRGVVLATQLERVTLADVRGLRVKSFQKPVVLGSWPDGSVKWLLLDFLANVPAQGSATFTLGLADTSNAGDPQIHVTEDAQRFTVDTGRLKVELSKERFSFVDAAWVDADGDHVYTAAEKVVSGPGEMFIDLDAVAPGVADSGVYDHPDTNTFGMEGGNWMRKSQATTATRYLASEGEYSLSLFREGQSHVVFKLEGWHRDPATARQFGKYTLYLHFYLYQSFVRASHTWIMTGDPDKNFIRRMAIELPFAGVADTLDYAFGGRFETEGAPVTLDPAHEPFVSLTPGPSELLTGKVSRDGEVALVAIGPDKYYHNLPLSQDLTVSYELIEDGAVSTTGAAPSGWGSVSAGGVGLAAGIRDFWREHPKEVQYAKGRLGVYLWPDHGDRTLDLRRRYPELRGTVDQGWGKAARREFVAPGSAVGLAKTTDLFFDFHAGAAPAEVDRRFRSFQDPLRPFAGGAYNVATGVFGPVVAYDPKNYFKLENYLDLMMARIMRSQREYHWVGWLDYGDYLPEFEKQSWELDLPSNPKLYTNWGYAGWLQEGYRFGQWAFVQYFRSGRYRYLRAADSWLRHTRDVDCVYWETPDDGPHPADNENDGPRKGGGHRHDQQHWGAYMTGYGIPTIALVHHYFFTGEGRDLDAMRDNADWILHAGRYYENYSEYAVLYMAEALSDSTLMAEALAHDEKPQSAFGRATYDSGMGLMLHDIHTGGTAAVRAKLRQWADLDESSAGYLRAYLESKENTGAYLARIESHFDATFPASSITASRYKSWAPRVPTDFRDVFSQDIMPDGPWSWPIRMLESAQFDGPGGMGNDLGRHSNQMALMWSMSFFGRGL